MKLKEVAITKTILRLTFSAILVAAALYGCSKSLLLLDLPSNLTPIIGILGAGFITATTLLALDKLWFLHKHEPLTKEHLDDREDTKDS